MEQILQNNKITSIYTDGAFSSKTQIGAWAFIVLDLFENVILRRSSACNDTTNNRMEMQAVINAMQFIIESKIENEITIFSDSKYLVDGINSWIKNWIKNNWKTYSKEDVKNKDLWIIMQDCKTKLRNIKIEWVKAHAENKFNNMVDEIACNLTKKTWIIYSLSESKLLTLFYMIDKSINSFPFKDWEELSFSKDYNSVDFMKEGFLNEKRLNQKENQTSQSAATLITMKYLKSLKAIEYYIYIIKQNNDQISIISQSNQNLINFMTLTMNGIEQRKSQLQELMISYKDKIDFVLSEFDDSNTLIPIDIYFQQQKNVAFSLFESASSMSNSIQTFAASFNKSINAMYNISQQTQYQVSAITTVLDTLEQYHSSDDFRNEYKVVPKDIVVCFEEMKTKEKDAINSFNVIQNHIKTIDLISSSCKILLQQSQQLVNQIKNIVTQISSFYDIFHSKINSANRK